MTLSGTEITRRTLAFALAALSAIRYKQRACQVLHALVTSCIHRFVVSLKTPEKSGVCVYATRRGVPNHDANVLPPNHM